jgi:teichuronic acid biosynthesis glycosyltransferase TuaC
MRRFLYSRRPLTPLVTLERHVPDADVLMVTNAWPHEGDGSFGIFARRQVDALAAAGLRIDVMFVRGVDSPLAYAVAAWRLLRLSVRRRRPYRLVHGQGGETLLSILFWRGPRIVSFWGDDLLGTPDEQGRLSRSSRVKAAVLRRLARATTATITMSREMEAALPERLRRRNTVLPHGVDVEAFRPADRAACRSRLGWPPDGAVALFAADPGVPRKRHWLAQAACEEAARRGVPVTLHVAKDVPPAEMPAVMNAVDCLLITSTIEGSANIVKEALMCDVPVVGTPAGDLRERLEGVHPSRVCEPTAEALADGLLECVEAGGRCNGRENALWLDERALAGRLVGLYDELGGPA